MLNLREGGAPRLAFRGVTIADPDGSVAIGPFDLTVGAGERVLIEGDVTAAIKLYKATAGLWPWGHGDIELPAGEPIFFMPQKPYVPPGTLRDVICYPNTTAPCADATVAEILTRVGLPELAARLDDAERWDQSLASDELQRLGFARLLMHRPLWAFLQDSMDALGAEGQAEMLRLVDAALPEYYQRRLTLVRHNGYSIVEEAAPTLLVQPA